jgi:hypothetical protein
MDFIEFLKYLYKTNSDEGRSDPIIPSEDKVVRKHVQRSLLLGQEVHPLRIEETSHFLVK